MASVGVRSTDSKTIYTKLGVRLVVRFYKCAAAVCGQNGKVKYDTVCKESVTLSAHYMYEPVRRRFT